MAPTTWRGCAPPACMRSWWARRSCGRRTPGPSWRGCSDRAALCGSRYSGDAFPRTKEHRRCSGSHNNRLVLGALEPRLRHLDLEARIDLDPVDRVVAAADQSHQRADVSGLLAREDLDQVVVRERQARHRAPREEIVRLLLGWLGHRLHSTAGFARGNTRCTRIPSKGCEPSACRWPPIEAIAFAAQARLRPAP